MSEALLVTCRCGTVYDAGESFYCPVCSAPRNLAQPMQQPAPGGPPMGGPQPGPPQGSPGAFGGPAPMGPGPGMPMGGGYPEYGMPAMQEKSKSDIAQSAGRLLQALSFAVLALGILAVLGLVVLAFTSSAGKVESAVQALTVLVTTVGFFGLLRFGALVADYLAHKYEDEPQA